MQPITIPVCFKNDIYDITISKPPANFQMTPDVIKIFENHLPAIIETHLGTEEQGELVHLNSQGATFDNQKVQPHGAAQVRWNTFLQAIRAVTNPERPVSSSSSSTATSKKQETAPETPKVKPPSRPPSPEPKPIIEEVDSDEEEEPVKHTPPPPQTPAISKKIVVKNSQDPIVIEIANQKNILQCQKNLLITLGKKQTPKPNTFEETIYQLLQKEIGKDKQTNDSLKKFLNKAIQERELEILNLQKTLDKKQNK